MATNRTVLSASDMTGNPVKNLEGDDLGNITALMIDPDTGRIEYAVLSFGGFLGLGDKLFAIPWQALELNIQEKHFVLNVKKECLEKAPGFDKEDWPDMADPQFRDKIYTHYGYDIPEIV
ncbi:MAG: PRC-barrel [Rickettsiales bacterium]|jgi:sporulation protein YlmC with PRC-barrel domain|nr:PRC-barrel [Rickettsiales bacterium]